MRRATNSIAWLKGSIQAHLGVRVFLAARAVYRKTLALRLTQALWALRYQKFFWQLAEQVDAQTGGWFTALNHRAYF